MAYQVKKTPTKKPVYRQERSQAVLPQKPRAPKQKKSKGKVFGQILFSLVLFLLVGISFGFTLLPEINTVQIDRTPDKIGITTVEENENLTTDQKEEVAQAQDNVINVLLIGLDGEGYKGRRSDVMMIMTINKLTKEIKLTSLSRDTMVYLPMQKTFEKLTHAYVYGEALGTLSAVNANLDMNIQDFVVFDYNALRQLVNSVGGVTVNVEQGEYDELGSTYLPGVGLQRLNGEQALMYARVRHGNTGGDQGRNDRQREILESVFKSAKKLSLTQLVGLANNLVPNIQTSYDYGRMIDMLEYFQTIKSGAELTKGQWPTSFWGGIWKGDKLWYMVPRTLESNVTDLHKDIFKLESYSPSDKVLEISNKIIERTGIK